MYQINDWTDLLEVERTSEDIFDREEAVPMRMLSPKQEYEAWLALGYTED